MVEAKDTLNSSVNIRIELFGVARMVAGRHHVETSVPRRAGTGDLAAALAETCPGLVGGVIRDDRSGLLESYTFNLNGRAFLSDERLNLEPSDTVLVFSSQAGG